MIIERRQRVVPASAEAVYRVFTRLGGATGWLCMDWAWQVRGALDRLLGGVGYAARTTRPAGRARG